ncbi:MAG: isoprenyl transferase [Christensenellaceae bacterium]|nr:isoprenyl transferase [Christensenellaceae bacterium]
MKLKLDANELGLDPKALPRHVAIIMDGNGRWAKKRLLPRSMGHRAGVDTVKEIVRASSDLGISALTLYAFSTENWKRPKEEVSVLMSLLVEYLRRELEELFAEGVRFRFIGLREGLSKEVLDMLDEATERTRENTGLTLCIAFNYGSRAEIVRAVQKVAEDYKAGILKTIDEKAIADRLMTADIPDPDLVIRTSGEQRISNYLLWQIAYAEFYFTDVYWPDFHADEYVKALRSFVDRDRRFGGVK